MQDNREDLLDLFRCFCICHEAIQIQEETNEENQVKGGIKEGKIQYSGSSLDEVAFLNMCRDSGIACFLERHKNTIKIQIDDQVETYEIAHVIKFNSKRKRMSVIV